MKKVKLDSFGKLVPSWAKDVTKLPQPPKPKQPKKPRKTKIKEFFKNTQKY